MSDHDCRDFYGTTRECDACADNREMDEERCSHWVAGTCDYCQEDERDYAEEAFNAALLREV